MSDTRSLDWSIARPGPAPSRDDLVRNAMRQLAGAALVVLAAATAHRTGHADEQWQYAAVAASLLPQALVDGLAFRDPDRRARLRTSRRPAPLPLLAAVLLGAAAVLVLVSGGSPAVVTAAVCATAGLAIAAAPVTVVVTGRRKDGGRPA